MTTSPVEDLLLEHALTRRALTLLLRMAEQTNSGAGFPAEDVATLLGYFREFLEHLHHRKEDQLVYPAAILAGADECAEEVGGLTGEHEVSKSLLHSLTLFWEPGELLPEERKGFVEVARTYAARIRRHMDMEEAVVFPALDQLQEGDRKQLENALRNFCGPEPHRHWSTVIAGLEERWSD